MIGKQTAMDIALAYREVEAAEDLIRQIDERLNNISGRDIRDTFGRQVQGLQMGIPSGPASTTCFNVPYSMARPILEAHIANQRALIATLTEKARIEMDAARAMQTAEGRA